MLPTAPQRMGLACKSAHRVYLFTRQLRLALQPSRDGCRPHS
ncbi:hypothetical protein J2802_005079 [Paraburkholderia caribensis]|nr:hypothetical protein [Paraburkholderia caribensis]